MFFQVQIHEEQVFFQLGAMLELSVTQDYNDVIQCQENNYETWGHPLSMEQYKFRDYYNYQSKYLKFDRNLDEELNGVIYFVLKDNEDDIIRSSCEVLIRDCWYKIDNDIRTVKCGVIGSVFTPKQFRGQGYATIMINQLMEMLKNKYLQSENDVVFLYSEVGEYYSKFGFKSYNVPVYEIKVDNFQNSDKSIINEKIRPIYNFDESDSNIKEIMKSFEESILQGMEESGNNVFAVKPNVDIFQFFANRANIDYLCNKHCNEVPTEEMVRKAQIVQGFQDCHNEANYVLVNYNFSSKTCYVLAMNCSDKETQQEMLRCVYRQSAEYGVETLCIWGENGIKAADFPVEFCGKTEKLLGNPSLPALQSLRNLQNSVGEFAPHLTWVANGKWCWY